MIIKKNKNKIVSFILIFVVFAVSFALTALCGEENKVWKDIFKAFGVCDSWVNTGDSKSESGADQYKMKVHFLNVGKADCAYIKCEDYNILIDAADKELSYNVVEYLKRCGVKKLDLAIATHPHRDHIGQMPEVINEFEVKRFLMSEIPESITPTSGTYISMLNALKTKNVPVDIAKPGDKIVMGGLTADILGPCAKSENMNNNSVVVKFTYGSDRFLFMGDAQKEEEEDIMRTGFDLSADVLKVGHHGSLTSTTKKLVDAVRPKYSVISVCADRNNLPKSVIVNRLRSVRSEILRTDLNGNIVFMTNGIGIKVVPEREAS